MGGSKGYAEDILFIISEAAQRQIKLNEGRIKEIDRDDFMHTLPRQDGRGRISIGREAGKRLASMAAKALKERGLENCVDLEQAYNEVASEISRRFIDEQAPIDTKEARKAVASAIKRAAKGRLDLTHFFPCHAAFEKKHDTLSIGPVTFRSRKSVLTRIEQAVARRAEGVDFTGPNLAQDISVYYSNFGTVAEVHVVNCDEKTSKTRALKTAQAAVDCLHLLIGACSSRRLILGGPGVGRDHRGHVAITPNEVAAFSANYSWNGSLLRDDWLEEFEGWDVVRLMGITLEHLAAGIAIPPLSLRFIDGATWFGEATRDNFPASKVVKYVLAIERILITNRKDRTKTRTFTERGASFIFDRRVGPLADLEKRFKKLYELRSDVAHGSVSPHDPRLLVGVSDAERLARRILIRALEFYKEEGLRKTNVPLEKLEDGFKKVRDWALQEDKPV